jgi:hypothetical protein
LLLCASIIQWTYPRLWLPCYTPFLPFIKVIFQFHFSSHGHSSLPMISFLWLQYILCIHSYSMKKLL